MTVAVEISATPEFEASEPTIRQTLRRLEERLNTLAPDELERVLEATRARLSRPPTHRPRR